MWPNKQNYLFINTVHFLEASFCPIMHLQPSFNALEKKIFTNQSVLQVNLNNFQDYLEKKEGN